MFYLLVLRIGDNFGYKKNRSIKIHSSPPPKDSLREPVPAAGFINRKNTSSKIHQYLPIKVPPGRPLKRESNTPAAGSPGGNGAGRAVLWVGLELSIGIMLGLTDIFIPLSI